MYIACLGSNNCKCCVYLWPNLNYIQDKRLHICRKYLATNQLLCINLSIQRHNNHKIGARYQLTRQWGKTLTCMVILPLAVVGVLPSFSTTCDWCCDAAWLVAWSCMICPRPLAICKRRSRVLNMTIDLAATKFAPTITHDIWDQWHDLSAIYLRVVLFCGCI